VDKLAFFFARKDKFSVVGSNKKDGAASLALTVRRLPAVTEAEFPLDELSRAIGWLKRRQAADGAGLGRVLAIRSGEMVQLIPGNGVATHKCEDNALEEEGAPPRRKAAHEGTGFTTVSTRVSKTTTTTKKFLPVQYTQQNGCNIILYWIVKKKAWYLLQGRRAGAT